MIYSEIDAAALWNAFEAKHGPALKLNGQYLFPDGAQCFVAGTGTYHYREQATMSELEVLATRLEYHTTKLKRAETTFHTAKDARDLDTAKAAKAEVELLRPLVTAIRREYNARPEVIADRLAASQEKRRQEELEAARAAVTWNAETELDNLSI
jgi:hypothetical protein